MNTYLTTRFGIDIANPSPEEIDGAIAELDVLDNEHPDVSFRNENEWCLSIFNSGLVILENLEDGYPCHKMNVTYDQLKKIIHFLSTGNIDELKNCGWTDGYGKQ